MDAAYKCMQDGYYGYYEVCGFERQTMSRISGARKNEVELAYNFAGGWRSGADFIKNKGFNVAPCAGIKWAF